MQRNTQQQFTPPAFIRIICLHRAHDIIKIYPVCDWTIFQSTLTDYCDVQLLRSLIGEKFRETANRKFHILIDLKRTIDNLSPGLQAEVAEVTSFPSSMEGALERPKCL